MLSQMRRGAGSWAAKILMLLLVATFGFWGVGDYITGQSSRWVAKVGDQEISQVQFSNDFRREISNMQARLGAQIDVEQARQVGLANASLGRMVEKALLRQAVHDSGIVISDDVVRENISADPRFRGVGQRFDRNVFQSILRNNGYTETRYIDEVRQQIALEQLLGSFSAGPGAAPAAMTDAAYRFRFERRVADYFILPLAAMPAVADPDEKVLEEFYESRREIFALPETRSVTFVTLSPQAFAESVTVTDDDLREEYAARRQEFETQAKREVQQLVYRDAEAAKAAHERLLKGESVGVVAKSTLGIEESETKLGKITGDDLPDAIAEKVFQLKVNEISEPLQSKIGWHVVKVLSVEAPTVRAFDDVKIDLRQQIALRLAGDLLIEARNRVDDSLAGGARLEELAAELKLPVKTIPQVDAQGRDASGKKIADLPGTAAFLTAVFAAAEGAEPSLEDSGNGGYVVIRVDAIQPASAKPLAQVRGVAIEIWKAEQARKAAATKARELADRISTGMGMMAAANEVRAISFQTKPIKRDDKGGDARFSAAAIEKLFSLKPGEAAAAPGPDGGQIVLSLAQIEPANPASDEASAKRLKQEMAQAITGDLYAHYRAHLESRIGVTIDQAALDTAF